MVPFFSRVSTSIHLSLFECLRAWLDPARQKGLGAPQRSTCNKMNKTLLNRTSSQNFKSLIAKGLKQNQATPFAFLNHFWFVGTWPEMKWSPCLGVISVIVFVAISCGVARLCRKVQVMHSLNTGYLFKIVFFSIHCNPSAEQLICARDLSHQRGRDRKILKTLEKNTIFNEDPVLFQNIQIFLCIFKRKRYSHESWIFGLLK